MDRKPPIAAELVEQFVTQAHVDLKQVRQLLAQEPALIHAACDWGGGDWETGLGAAAHVGRRDIALYLLEQGARMDLFAATMLGKLEIVQALMADNPALIEAKGPHGIPLLRHAEAGGDEAAEMLAYLQSLSQ
jgi:hypothetical protein